MRSGNGAKEPFRHCEPWLKSVLTEAGKAIGLHNSASEQQLTKIVDVEFTRRTLKTITDSIHHNHSPRPVARAVD
jgi:hypothetical protein